jgi:hypothetical protein
MRIFDLCACSIIMKINYGTLYIIGLGGAGKGATGRRRESQGKRRKSTKCEERAKAKWQQVRQARQEQTMRNEWGTLIA